MARTRQVHRTTALLALTLGVFLVTLNVTVVVVALPAIAASLHASSGQSAWIIDAYNLVGASLLLSAGSLADRFGRKRLLLAGYALFVAGAALCALATSVASLLVFRVVMAVGGTALTPTSLAIVANLYPDARERARAIGIWGVSSGLGLGLGPIVGGAVVDGFGWRAVFAVNAAVGLVALAIVLRVVPSSRSPRARRLDLAGQALITAALATLTYALIEAPGDGWTSPRTLGLILAAGAVAGIFAAVELRRIEPLVDLRFFRDRQFAGAVVITVAVFFAFGGFIYENALYLQEARGYSALGAGLMTLPAAAPTLAGGPFAGWLVATRGPRGVLTAGTLLMAAGIGVLALLPGGAPVLALLAAYALIGVGYAVINAPISTVAVASMPRAQAGVAAGIASSGRNVGIVLGIAVVASVAASGLPESLPSGAGAAVAYADALRPAYGCAAAVALIAVAAAVLTMRATPPESHAG